MWGKTADEVAGIAMQLNDALQNATRPAPQAPPQNAGPQLPSDDDYLRTPGMATQQAIQTLGGQMLAQTMSPLVQQMASMVRNQAQTLYADDFKRWGPEIEAYVARVPVEQRTLDLFKGAVNIVRGEHLDELANERAKTLLAQGGLSERGGAGGGFGTPSQSNGAVDFAKLPGGMKEIAERHGFTVGMLMENLKKMGMSPEQWMEQAQNQQTMSSTGAFSFQMNEGKLNADRPFS